MGVSYTENQNLDSTQILAAENNWTFGLNKGYHLRFHKETKIKRHIKVQNDKSLTMAIGLIGAAG